MSMAGYGQWEREEVGTQDGRRVEAIAPVILSASRATDVPAFYAEWFWNRIRAGYFKWVNPFNAGQVQTISTTKARAVVFWSKNPKPLMEGMDELDRRGIHYYFQYTINDYEAEGYEPHVPKLETRIDTFRRLAGRIGPERVVWRMDPLMRTEKVGIAELLEKAAKIAAGLGGHAKKLVFSYADIRAYAGVRRNLDRAAAGARELTTEEMNELARGLAEVARANGIREIATCGEGLDQTGLGVAHNRCIDDELMIRLWPGDGALMEFLGHEGEAPFGGHGRRGSKDKGQRRECGCVASKDVGRYGTCPHLCAYCYANSSPATARSNYMRHRADAEAI